MPKPTCSTHVARLTHRCDRCNHPIFPLDRYERTVTIRKNGRYGHVLVLKKHLNPYCPFDDPDFDEEERIDEAHHELPMAA